VGEKMARFAMDIIEPIKQKIKKTVRGPLADIALNEIADNENCQLKVLSIHTYSSWHRKVKQKPVPQWKMFCQSIQGFAATPLLAPNLFSPRGGDACPHTLPSPGWGSGHAGFPPTTRLFLLPEGPACRATQPKWWER